LFAFPCHLIVKMAEYSYSSDSSDVTHKMLKGYIEGTDGIHTYVTVGVDHSLDRQTGCYW
jgi:hypothetical protein